MTGEIIDGYGDQLEKTTLIRGSKGQFEVTVDGQLVFSKAAEHRHAEPGEVIEKMRPVAAQDRSTVEEAWLGGGALT